MRSERSWSGPLLPLYLFAGAATLGALVAVVAGYDRLPEVLPVTRWSSAPRSPMLAVRVPAINALSLVLVHALATALRRTPLQRDANSVAAALLLTVGAKASIEGIELLLLPATPWWILPALGFTVLGGLGAALVVGRKFLQGGSRPNLELTAAERGLASAAVLGIAFLQLAPWLG